MREQQMVPKFICLIENTAVRDVKASVINEKEVFSLANLVPNGERLSRRYYMITRWLGISPQCLVRAVFRTWAARHCSKVREGDLRKEHARAADPRRA
jgi:hypothetical protein